MHPLHLERHQRSAILSDSMRLTAVFLTAVFFMCTEALPQSSTAANTASQAPRWCDFAREDLQAGNGSTFDCVSEGRRCIRMNNYSCTKNFSSEPYEGQLISRDGKAVTDIDHHVIYEDPKWSIKASIDILRRYYLQKGKKSDDRDCGNLGSVVRYKWKQIDASRMGTNMRRRSRASASKLYRTEMHAPA